jgi:hypothetical protein
MFATSGIDFDVLCGGVGTLNIPYTLHVEACAPVLKRWEAGVFDIMFPTTPSYSGPFMFCILMQGTVAKEEKK